VLKVGSGGLAGLTSLLTGGSMFYVTPDPQNVPKHCTEGEKYPVLEVQFQLDRSPKFMVPCDDQKIRGIQSESFLFVGMTKGKAAKKTGQDSE
jgi:hypothetical protein